MPSDSETPHASSWLTPQGPREGLGHYIEVVRERWRLITACVLVATFAAGLYTKVASRTWQAQSQLLITPVNAEADLIGLSLITSSGNPTGYVSTAAGFVTAPEVATLAAARVRNTTPSTVLGDVSAAPLASSNIIAITATASSPSRARAIADAVAVATVEFRTQTLHAQLEKIIPALQRRVESLPPAERTGVGTIGERLATLETLAAGPDPTISVQAMARLPTAPHWPKTKLSIVVGFIVGLVVGLGAAFAMDALDPRVRREERLRGILQLPVLARIPRERTSASHGLPLRPTELSPLVHESYRMLRFALGIRGSSPVSRSIMITGATSSEGKSTVALNFAATLASAGKRVILIEADLRRPSLGAALGISVRRSTTDVLLEEVEFEDALVTVDWLGDNLGLLLADSAAPEFPDGLLASTDDLVDKAEALADYVIFDSAPVTEVSDSLPLSQHVDEVLVVTRLGHSRADQLVKMGEILIRQGVRPVGMVIVCGDFAQGSGYYYAQPGSKGSVLKDLRKRVFAGASSSG